MTTSGSPLPKIKAQADATAARLKAIERGAPVANDPAGKIDAARQRGFIKFGIVMDDKVITVEMPWATIRDLTEAGISEYIVELMRGSKSTVQ